MAFYVYLLLVFTFNYGQVTGCPVECVWNPWQTWQCDLCCKSNAGTNVAYRQRSVCCNTNSDVSACIKNCGYTQNDAQELDSCLRHCPMCATHAPTSTAQSSTRMTTLSTFMFTPMITKTTASISAANPAHTTATRSITTLGVHGPGYPVTHLIATDSGTDTHDLVTFTQREIDRRACLNECKGRSDLYDCLVECIQQPYTKLFTIGGPCLFLLGVLVGSTAVCFIKRMVDRKREQDNQTSVHPIKKTLDF